MSPSVVIRAPIQRYEVAATPGSAVRTRYSKSHDEGMLRPVRRCAGASTPSGASHVGGVSNLHGSGGNCRLTTKPTGDGPPEWTSEF